MPRRMILRHKVKHGLMKTETYNRLQVESFQEKKRLQVMSKHQETLKPATLQIKNRNLKTMKKNKKKEKRGQTLLERQGLIFKNVANNQVDQ